MSSKHQETLYEARFKLNPNGAYRLPEIPVVAPTGGATGLVAIINYAISNCVPESERLYE